MTRRSKLTGGVCQDCRQRIIYVQMFATGRMVPVDPIPDDEGNVCARYDGPGRYAGYVISADHPATSSYTRYTAHFGTCPDRPRPGQTRTPKPAPAETPTLFDT